MFFTLKKGACTKLGRSAAFRRRVAQHRSDCDAVPPWLVGRGYGLRPGHGPGEPVMVIDQGEGSQYEVWGPGKEVQSRICDHRHLLRGGVRRKSREAGASRYTDVGWSPTRNRRKRPSPGEWSKVTVFSEG